MVNREARLPWRWHGPADVRRSALPHPKPVLPILRVGNMKLTALFLGAKQPAMALGVAICKGEAATAIVVDARNIIPDGRLHAEGKGRIIQVLGIFVHQHPEQRRPRRANTRELAVGEPR